MTAFGYSLIAVAYACALLAALSPGSLLYRIRIPGVQQLAVWSYSLYLSHKAVAHLVDAYARQQAWGEAATIGAIGCISLALAAALHFAVERPFMVLRDRLVPGNFEPLSA
jgi:peptidoglycan/LPS O-acetylase OafA/YrhL